MFFRGLCFLFSFFAIFFTACKKEAQNAATAENNSATVNVVSCTPGSTGTEDCKTDIPNSVLATKSKTCNQDGQSYTYGSCTLAGCSALYHISNNSCVANSCSPNQGSGNVDCKSSIPFSSVAYKTSTCNSSGSGYIYGSCLVSSCQTGYYIQNNTCVANACAPDQVFGDVDCKSEIPNSSNASKSKTCNSLGTDYLYGECSATACQSGYHLQNNSCVANACTPNQSYGSVDCKSEIPNASSASKTKTCNSFGTDFIYGACTVSTCQSGHYIKNNSCNAIASPTVLLKDYGVSWKLDGYSGASSGGSCGDGLYLKVPTMQGLVLGFIFSISGNAGMCGAEEGLINTWYTQWKNSRPDLEISFEQMEPNLMNYSRNGFLLRSADVFVNSNYFDSYPVKVQYIMIGGKLIRLEAFYAQWAYARGISLLMQRVSNGELSMPAVINRPFSVGRFQSNADFERYINSLATP